MSQSPADPASTPWIAQVVSNELFQAMDEAALADVASEIELVHFPAGASLFKQGDPGDSMYFLVKGRLGVTVSIGDGAELELTRAESGVTVGEMALLTGQPRVGTVRALEDSELVKFSKAGFDRLALAHPDAMKAFAESILPRLRWAELARVLIDLFGELDAEALSRMQDELEWLHLSGGEVLFLQGEPGDALFVVVNGRLRIVAEAANTRETVLSEVSRGETVGEFALLTGEPRSATVYAVRDTDLVKLSRASFDHLLAEYPKAGLEIARMIARRNRQPYQGAASTSLPAATFAVVPVGPSVLLSEFTARLAQSLEALGPTIRLSSDRFDSLFGKSEAAQTPQDHPTNVTILGWMSNLEAKHRFLVFETDPEWTAWTERCLRQADRLVFLAHAGDAPGAAEVISKAQRVGTKALAELVLIQPMIAERPNGTADWLSGIHLNAHHHVRLYHDEDFQRLARRLTGTAFGLVFSGGAARGFAHIGALRALEEADLKPDFIGGTSMGALIGASVALGMGPEEQFRLAQTFASPKQLFDYTLPLTSLTATRKVTDMLIGLFGEVRIEDLWRPYFCISSNLSRAEMVVHREGLLWKAVRASLAIPGIFSPILKDGDVLVDGGVMNNFPVDVMRELCGPHGIVVGVNSTPPKDKLKDYDFGASLSGWRILWSRLNPFARKIRAPSLVGTILRAQEINTVQRMSAREAQANLVIRPAVEGYSIMDFARYEEIIDIGYHAGKKQLEGWNRHSAA